MSGRILKLAHKVNGVLVCPIAAVSVLHVCGDVAAQSHYVLNTRVLDFSYHRAYGVAVRGHAGEMRQGGHAVLFLDILCDLKSVLTRSAPRAVCNAHKGGV